VTECYQKIRMELQFHTDPGSTWSPSCINCTHSVVRLRNSWWWAERLPETCRVIIPIIKLELSASVSFIHKESFRLLALLRICTAESYNCWLYWCFLPLNQTYWSCTCIPCCLIKFWFI
jgi:hypothetical protein